MDAKLEFSMGRAQAADARAPISVHFLIQDEVSRTVLARFEVSEHDFMRLLGNTQITVDGFTSDHLDRVGLTAEYGEIRVPSAVTSLHGYDEKDEIRAITERWAAEQDPTWQEYSARKHNYGWSVHMTRWVQK